MRLCERHKWKEPCPELCGEMCMDWLSTKCQFAKPEKPQSCSSGVERKDMTTKKEPQSFPEHAAVILGDKISEALKSCQGKTISDALGDIASALQKIASQLERFNDIY